jgi:betaine-aldehyde dehydrogenase
MTSLSSRTTHPMLIGGEFRDASDCATIDAVAPATGEVLGTFPAGTRAGHLRSTPTVDQLAPSCQNSRLSRHPCRYGTPAV